METTNPLIGIDQLLPRKYSTMVDKFISTTLTSSKNKPIFIENMTGTNAELSY